MQISKAFVTYGIRRWRTRLQSALPSNCGDGDAARLVLRQCHQMVPG